MDNGGFRIIFAKSCLEAIITIHYKLDPLLGSRDFPRDGNVVEIILVIA